MSVALLPAWTSRCDPNTAFGGCISPTVIGTLRSMDERPPGASTVHVDCDDPPWYYELHYFGSSEFAVPGWWLGVHDDGGHLHRSEFLASGSDPGEVFAWLKPVTGTKPANHLVRMAQDAVVRSR